MANLATKAGVEGQGFRIQAPLQNLSKAQIVQAGVARRRLQPDRFLLSGDDNGRACGK
jgi:7-cyano-7-deazaguanine synthase